MDIQQVMLDLKLVESGEIEAGGLACKTETLDDASAVIEKFRDFGGEGWFCATDSPEIRRFSPQAPLTALSDTAWPIAGEAVSGDNSLHLCRSATGWELTTITREQKTELSVLMRTVLRARDNQGDLQYEVAWEPTDVAGLTEMRPAAYRFLGFVKS